MLEGVPILPPLAEPRREETLTLAIFSGSGVMKIWNTAVPPGEMARWKRPGLGVMSSAGGGSGSHDMHKWGPLGQFRCLLAWLGLKGPRKGRSKEGDREFRVGVHPGAGAFHSLGIHVLVCGMATGSPRASGVVAVVLLV